MASLFLLHSFLFMTRMAGHTEATPETCPSTATTTPQTRKLLNSAFVFIKPHANTEKVHNMVVEKLENAGISILSQLDIGGEEIDQKRLIDQHYYSIASKATILPANKIPVPLELFEETYGESWENVLSDGRACNAVEACKRFECNTDDLNKAWNRVSAVKLGGGFYCGTSITTSRL